MTKGQEAECLIIDGLANLMRPYIAANKNHIIDAMFNILVGNVCAGVTEFGDRDSGEPYRLSRYPMARAEVSSLQGACTAGDVGCHAEFECRLASVIRPNILTSTGFLLSRLHQCLLSRGPSGLVITRLFVNTPTTDKQMYCFGIYNRQSGRSALERVPPGEATAITLEVVFSYTGLKTSAATAIFIASATDFNAIAITMDLYVIFQELARKFSQCAPIRTECCPNFPKRLPFFRRFKGAQINA
jgi:hypothetical protein